MTYNVSVFFMIGAAFLAAASQILLKKSSLIKRNKNYKNYINPMVLSGYVVLIITMMMNILAYRQIDYKLGPILNASSYIFVIILSSLLLNEKITKQKVLGSLLIIFGIVVYNIF